jgi:mono/diheme cytochrome c family protein
LRHPTAKMKAGGMPAPDVTPEEMKQLVAYVASLK